MAVALTEFKQKHMSRGAEGQPKNIEELVESMEQRRVLRRLHELGDEGVALILEAAAVRADDSQAENAVRDLRRHLMEGETVTTFLDKYPRHRRVNFNNLDLDLTLVEVTKASLLLGTGHPPEPPDGALSHTRTVVDRPRLNLVPADRAKAEELFENHPVVIALFLEQERWEEDGQDRLIQRSQIQALFVSKKPDTAISDSYRSVLMNDYWAKWTISNPSAGRKLTGRGQRIFLTESEAVNFLWFIQQKISSNKSSNRGITLARFAPEIPKKK